MERFTHEIKNPLQAMSLRIDLCKDEKNINKIHEHIKIISKNKDYLFFFLMDIKDSLLLKNGKFIIRPNIFKAKDLINDIKDLYELSLKEKNLELKIEVCSVL